MIVYSQTATHLVALVRRDAGHEQLVRLGALPEVTRQLHALRHAFTALAQPTEPARRRQRVEAVGRAALRLQPLVLPPGMPDGPLVIVPNATVAGLPFGLLPDLAARPTVFALHDRRPPAGPDRGGLGRHIGRHIGRNIGRSGA